MYKNDLIKTPISGFQEWAFFVTYSKFHVCISFSVLFEVTCTVSVLADILSYFDHTRNYLLINENMEIV